MVTSHETMEFLISETRIEQLNHVFLIKHYFYIKYHHRKKNDVISTMGTLHYKFQLVTGFRSARMVAMIPQKWSPKRHRSLHQK